MKRFLSVLLILCFAFSLFACSGDISSSNKNSGNKNSELKIKEAKVTEECKKITELVNKYSPGDIKPDAGKYYLKRIIVQTDGTPLDLSKSDCADYVDGGNGHYVIQFKDEKKAEEVCNKLVKNEHIIYSEPDKIITLDEYVNGSDGADGHMSWGTVVTGLDVYSKYMETQPGKDVLVAVVDSGLQSSSNIFSGRINFGADLAEGISAGRDTIQHGTHVAGIIADSTMGLNNIKLMPIRVFKERSAPSSIIASAIRTATLNNADIINLSLGGDCSSDIESAVREALNKGIIVVAAAGNDNDNVDNACPAHIEGCITVAAIDRNKGKASFSNYGSKIDLAAPGVDILSTVPGGYSRKNGTSMATPFVSAMAAVLLSSGEEPENVLPILKAYSEDLGSSGWDANFGWGIPRLDILLREKTISIPTSLKAKTIMNNPAETQIGVKEYIPTVKFSSDMTFIFNANLSSRMGEIKGKYVVYSDNKDIPVIECKAEDGTAFSFVRTQEGNWTVIFHSIDNIGLNFSGDLFIEDIHQYINVGKSGKFVDYSLYTGYWSSEEAYDSTPEYEIKISSIKNDTVLFDIYEYRIFDDKSRQAVIVSGGKAVILPSYEEYAANIKGTIQFIDSNTIKMVLTEKPYATYDKTTIVFHRTNRPVLVS